MEGRREFVSAPAVSSGGDAVAVRTIASSLIIALFFLSGASSLVYEVLWVRMFTLVFGNTTHAVSTVLTAFMGGLALGSYLFGRVADRYEKWSLLLYGCLEGIIGAYALAVPVLISVLESVHPWAYTTFAPSSWVFIFLRFIVCLVILLIPTTMMGATLPLISKFLVRQRQTLGYGVGTLYGVNTAGAVAGCYLAGFVFIGSMGISQTLYLAVAANAFIMAGAVALGAYFRIRRPAGPWSAVPPEAVMSEADDHGEGWKRFVILGCFAVAGLASLCYEVLWTRVLVFFLGNSTYAFASMLTTFLVGIAMGSLLFARAADNARDRYLLFAAIEVVIAMWALISVPLFTKAFYALGESWRGFNIDLTWQSTTGWKFLKAFAVMSVPTLLMGGAFPVVCKIYSKDIGSIGKDVASVYSVNTVGGIVGSALAGFAIIPTLGVQRGIIAVAGLNLAIAMIALFLSRQVAVKKIAWLSVSAVVAAAALFLVPREPVLRRVDEKWDKLLFSREDSMALVKVFQTSQGNKNISINGYVVAGSNKASQECQKGLAHIPMLLHEDPRSVLIVGFGAGGTSWSTSLYGPDKIDCIEFVPSVPKAAPYLDEVNHGVLSVPFFNLTIDDGRIYLSSTDKKYDVLSIDAIDPKHAGSGSLYAVDFYKLCKKRLNPGGIVVEWLPYHLLTADETRIIMASFSSVFDHVTLWFTRYLNYLFLVGTDHELEIDYQKLSDRMSEPRIAADLGELDLYDPAEFIYCFAADTAAVESIAAEARGLNTYDRPLIEYYTYHKGQRIATLPFVRRRGLPKVVNLGSTPEEAARNEENLRLHLAVGDHLIRAKTFPVQEEPGKRLQQCRAALALDPSDVAALSLADTAESYIKTQTENLTALAETEPTFEVYVRLFDLYQQVGDLNSAAAALESAIRLRPASVEARLNLINLYEQMGEREKARQQRRLLTGRR